MTFHAMDFLYSCWRLTYTSSLAIRMIVLSSILFVGITLLGCAGEEATSPPANGLPDLSPVVEEILDVWQHADLVCLGETHGSVLDGALRQALVEHPRFAETVDVIVIEFANPLHQDLLDRLVLDLEPLTREALRPIWRDAGLGEMWELPAYEAFLRSVATANARLPPAERLPVVGAALAIDWRAVQGAADLAPYRDRIGHFESVLRRQVLTPGRKGLAIFGSGHCERRDPSVLSRLAATDGERVWAVFGFEAAGGVEAGHRALDLSESPELIQVTGTPYADLPSGDMFFEGHGLAGVRLGQLVDGIVSYGSAEDRVLDPADLDLPPDLAAELARRAQLWGIQGSTGGAVEPTQEAQDDG